MCVLHLSATLNAIGPMWVPLWLLFFSYFRLQHVKMGEWSRAAHRRIMGLLIVWKALFPELLFILCLGILSLSGFRVHGLNGSQQISLRHWLFVLWPALRCPFSLPSLTSLPASVLAGKQGSVIETARRCDFPSIPTPTPSHNVKSHLCVLSCSQQH